MAIVHRGDTRGLLGLSNCVKPLRSAKAWIRLATRYEFIRIMAIRIGALGLDIRPDRPALNGPFVEGDTCPLHGPKEVLNRAFNITRTIGVLDAENVHTSMMPGKEIVIKRGAQ
jgi:hypothetical protein